MSVYELRHDFQEMVYSSPSNSNSRFTCIDSEDDDEELLDVDEDPKQRWLDNVERAQQLGWREPIFAYCPNFKGYAWRLCTNWFETIPSFDRPIKYLEIGTLCGANLISVCKTYGKHPDSRFEVIDPWCDHDEYNEYLTPDDAPINVQDSNYKCFLDNIASVNEQHRVKIYRDFSYDVLLYLTEGDYDLIYIDGNHNPEYVLEDSVLAFRKLKIGGWMVFDDYEWVDEHQRGPKLAIDSFLKTYSHRLQNIIVIRGQAFAQKIR